jgi:hypothetical protein
MSSMVVGRCKSVDAMHSKGGYQEPIVVTTPILDHKDGHYVKPHKVIFMYPNFKKLLIQMLLSKCLILQ